MFQTAQGSIYHNINEGLVFFVSGSVIDICYKAKFILKTIK